MERAGWLKSDYLSEDEIARERAHSLGVPFVLLTRDDISNEALVLIPEPFARAHSAVAYVQRGSVLEVAFINLEDLAAIAALHPHLTIKPRLTNQASIKQALVLYQKHLKDTFGSALQVGESEALILHALLNQASDIHLDVAEAGTRVRYRIGGVLHDAMRLSAEAGSKLLGGVKSLAKLFPIAAVQEGKFIIEHGGQHVLVSVANVPGVKGEKITMRLARGEGSNQEHQQGFTLAALGLHGQALEAVHGMLHRRGGLVLVAGKSESGKTTTLYTLLDQIHAAHAAVSTIEESIEHTLAGVTQTQTRPDLGLGLLSGLRAVLRTDPDVVMVSTLESADTARVALEAAARGVLVFAAIDARSAAGAVEKLLLWGTPPALVSRALLGVIAQKLVKKLKTDALGAQEKLLRDESAALEHSADFARVLAALKEEEKVPSNVSWKDVLFYRDSQRQGLTGLQEVLVNTSAIKELIAQNADADELERVAREEGMLTLAEDALFKAAAGSISLEEALEVASE